MGGASLKASSWTWVDYKGGSTSSVVDASLSAGNHQLILSGQSSGVQIDKVMLLMDTSCTPTGDGSNCTQGAVATPSGSGSSSGNASGGTGGTGGTSGGSSSTGGSGSTGSSSGSGSPSGIVGAIQDSILGAGAAGASNVGDIWKSFVGPISSFIQAHRTIIIWIAAPLAALGLGSFIISRIAAIRLGMRAATMNVAPTSAPAAPSVPYDSALPYTSAAPSVPSSEPSPVAPSAPDSLPMDPAQAPMPAYAQEYQPSSDTKPPVS
jgi:hypothetical protein